MSRYRVALALTLALMTTPAVFAQAPTAPAAPAAPAAANTIPFTLVFDRPGSYECYPIVNGEKGNSVIVPPGQKTLDVELGTNTEEVEILDQVTGLVDQIPMGKIKPHRKVKVAPDAFNWLGEIVVKLNSKNGEPAATGVIQITYPGGQPVSRGLKAVDGGALHFYDIPLGAAEIEAYSTWGGDVVKTPITVAPSKGGEPMEVTMTLPIDVRTLAPSPAAPVGTAPGQTIIINNGEQAAPKTDWVSGLVGLAVLGGIVVFGLRFMKQKGLTVKDLLAQIGVDSPNAAVPSGPNAGLRQSEYGGSPLPPLPSLADLPVAGAAKGPVSIVAEPGFTGPRLIGLSGPAAGQIYALRSDTESMLAVGRDPMCTMPFPGDSALSRRHAVFLVNGAGWDVMDEGSTNGTFLNSMRIEGRAALSQGDEIQIGMSRFRFETE